MFEEILETVVGPWGLAAVLLLGTNGGRRLVRGAFKETVKAGMCVSDKAQEWTGDAKELAQNAREKAGDLAHNAKEKAGDMYAKVKGDRETVKGA